MLPSGRKPLFCCSRIARQRLVRGSRQWTHSPHCGEKRVTTWSPSRARRRRARPARRRQPPRDRARSGRSRRVGTGGGVEIGVADPAGDEPDQHLPGLRLGQLDLLDPERLPELLEHRGAHLHLKPPDGAAAASGSPRSEGSNRPSRGTANEYLPSLFLRSLPARKDLRASDWRGSARRTSAVGFCPSVSSRTVLLRWPGRDGGRTDSSSAGDRPILSGPAKKSASSFRWMRELHAAFPSALHFGVLPDEHVVDLPADELDEVGIAPGARPTTDLD